ncbi:MAG: RNase H1/viroplasmin domain-containing protein [Clostridium perfringens]|uniref:RNase H1/viroplasmin domain-containing protein n=1 Tax=Clostridium perfringens TaxID=1502 RepID=UPI0024BCD2AE|nr:RNase H1/viroplasmin domain-containing protein [Clostridium perfringens]ELC8454723.1 RNase H1/viroplasmin domain-containing protein [Clostridium perfringens]MDU2656262.1 RNase H1/viroplasmin domain-containing protein [Clostridium perfringens]
MSKKKPKKFYAIKVGKGVENIIVKSWDECSKLVLGFNATYKSFYTEDEAKAYLNQSVEDIEKTKVNTSKRKKGEVFIDFSLKKDAFEKFEAKCLEFGIKKKKLLNY